MAKKIKFALNTTLLVLGIVFLILTVMNLALAFQSIYVPTLNVGYGDLKVIDCVGAISGPGGSAMILSSNQSNLNLTLNELNKESHLCVNPSIVSEINSFDISTNKTDRRSYIINTLGYFLSSVTVFVSLILEKKKESQD